MSMTFLNQLGTIPVILITLTCIFILRGEQKEYAARRFLLFLLGLGVLLQLALFVTLRLSTETNTRSFFQLSELLTPSLLGITALIGLNVIQMEKMDRKTRIMVALLGLAMIILFVLLYDFRTGMGMWIVPEVLTLMLGWALVWRRDRLMIVLSLLCLVWLGWFNYSNSHPPDFNAEISSIFYWMLLTFGISNIFLLAVGIALTRRHVRLLIIFGLLYLGVLGWAAYSIANPPDFSSGTPLSYMLLYSFGYGYSIWPGLTVITSAALASASLQKPVAMEDIPLKSPSNRMRLFMLGLAILLPLILAYVSLWSSVWDSTNDGLSGLFISRSSALIAMGAGMLMTLALRGKARLAGLVFILVVPFLLYQSFEAGWRVSYHDVTERRAESIAKALEQFHSRKGFYPESLAALTPRDILFIQQPVILAGEKWCYEGGANYYRLSAFYREFFSAPVSLRIYESAGDLPSSPPICEERLAEMKKKYYSPMEDPNAMQPPVPTPLPEIEVGLPKTDIYPLLNGSVALPGSWSPDSAYFFFGRQKNNQLELHFLIGETGEVCTADMQFSQVDGLRDNHAWLPDGRLLYAESPGDLTVLTPCQLGADHLTGLLPDTLDQISVNSAENGRILLNDKAAFWIMDGRTFDMQKIPDVTPNPYEFHWDNFVWLQGGAKLAISRLNGRQGSGEGATLFLVDAVTGDVQNSLDLEGEFGQSSPWIEGLTDQKILVHSQDGTLIADFSTQPVTVTNVMEQIFGLDIKVPDEISAGGSHVDENGNGYYLSVRLNHPHNQSTYLYYSETGHVYVYEHEYHTLLLFPDGYSMEMPLLETVPSYRDEYDIVMVDDPETVQPRIKITGHTPREYPHLSIEYLMKSSQLAVASAHGVSLVSLSDGEMLAYWSLVGDGYSPWIIASPDGSALIASKDIGGLYYIPLP